MHTATIIIDIVNACEDWLTDACDEHEVDFDIARDAALRYVARAAAPGDCEEDDLIRAVAAPIGGVLDPFFGRVFAVVSDAFDEVVVWSDEHGRAGRFVVSLEIFAPDENRASTATGV